MRAYSRVLPSLVYSGKGGRREVWNNGRGLCADCFDCLQEEKITARYRRSSMGKGTRKGVWENMGQVLSLKLLLMPIFIIILWPIKGKEVVAPCCWLEMIQQSRVSYFVIARREGLWHLSLSLTELYLANL